jgi:hypothetical protein
VSHVLKKLLVSLIVFNGCIATARVNKDVKINLCLNQTKPKNQELFKNLLELQLLLFEDVETGDCATEWSNKSYVFRQELVEITADNRVLKNVISALYHPDGYTIFRQMELIEQVSRKTMTDRSKQLAQLLKRAIDANERIPDPFSSNEAHGLPVISLGTKIPSDDTKNELSTVRETTELKKSSLGIFIGMKRISEAHHDDRAKKKVVSKPFVIIGLNFLKKIGASPLIVNAHALFAYSSLELLRPVDEKKPKSRFKTVGISTALSWHMNINTYLAFRAGLIIEGSYFDSDLKERVIDAYLSRYLQLKEGLSIEAVVTAFDSALSFHSAYFPLVQNFSLPSKVPFINFGWLLAIEAESKLYRSFALRFSLYHSSDHFDVSSTLRSKRVVASSSLAYLSITMRI